MSAFLHKDIFRIMVEKVKLWLYHIYCTAMTIV